LLGQVGAPAFHQQRRHREPLGRQETGPPVDYHHSESDVRREANQRAGIVARAEHDQLWRRDEQVDEHRAAGDLVHPGLARFDQLTRLGRRAGVQVFRAKITFNSFRGNDRTSPLSPLPFYRDERTNRKPFPAIEELSHAGTDGGGLDQKVDLPLATDSQIPGGDLVRARAVAPELGLPLLDHLQRHLAHVLLEAPSAHVAGGAVVLSDREFRPLVTIRGAAHADDGGECRSLPRGRGTGEEIEHFPGLEPLLHKAGIYLGCCPTRSANLSQKLSVSFWAVPLSSRAPTLATVPRTSELALHLSRERSGARGSISSVVLTSTPDPGAWPRADILRLLGGFTSDNSTSSWNRTFTAPTPNPETTLK